MITRAIAPNRQRNAKRTESNVSHKWQSERANVQVPQRLSSTGDDHPGEDPRPVLVSFVQHTVLLDDVIYHSCAGTSDKNLGQEQDCN